MYDAHRWHLRGEEYRAVASSLRHASARETYERMARHCDQMARLAGRRRRLTADDCLRLAAECDEFAVQSFSAATQAAVARIAQRWRVLAERATQVAALPPS